MGDSDELFLVSSLARGGDLLACSFNDENSQRTDRTDTISLNEGSNLK